MLEQFENLRLENSHLIMGGIKPPSAPIFSSNTAATNDDEEN